MNAIIIFIFFGLAALLTNVKCQNFNDVSKPELKRCVEVMKPFLQTRRRGKTFCKLLDACYQSYLSYSDHPNKKTVEIRKCVTDACFTMKSDEQEFPASLSKFDAFCENLVSGEMGFARPNFLP
ncbi:uncharacterized protein LOC123296294 [Chrysoperla carnea]|uniref:uncharacterized protein LOC123296294 n=1 Tax=Chrysoperla carnea TaxID=189513 RepID=UPI001D06EE69|nr:uncharacterized protein LOC123296294 [Chrysoperla carnea]